jgi:SpoVK/Ycf46/Vps4 family AAA+-type ATPase
MLGYENSLEHLLEELQRIDLLIRLQILKFRMMGREALDEFKGLYIAEDELDTILAEVGSCGARPEIDRAQLTPLLDHLAALEAQIAAKKAASRRAGTALCLERLQAVFQLSPFDVDVLLICLAPELDLRYEKLYAYLQDDVTQKRPSVDLVLHLLCPSFEARLAARQRFAPGCPLLKHSLLSLCDDPAHSQPSLLSKYLKVDERLVHYLLGSDELDVRLLPYAQRILPQNRLEDLLLPTDIKHRLTLLAREIKGEGLIFYFQGSYGTGKQTAAEALCRELGLGLLVVDGERLLNAREGTFDMLARLAMREALLHSAALYWRGFDALLADDKRLWLEALVQELENRQGLTFLVGDTAWEPADALQALPFVRLEFPRPAYSERVQLWAAALQDEALCGTDLDLRALANKFRFSAGQMRDAASTARNLARWRDPEHRHVTMADLVVACRLQSNRKLGTLAHKITPHYTWGDIILPADRLQQLREICNAVKYRAQVYDDWGFGRKLSLGKGLNVLFAGPSGTGKTMAAEIIAGELGLDLYKIDLSTVVSKYIGETEKNLAHIFAEAETSNAILFFDEADALFGKRSEVRDAHDRYANIEISYLLQRMEAYEGVVILATNLRKNMDDAFVRRLHFTVEFPLPSDKDRRRIWACIWPDDTPRSADLDLDFMARRFELAGGNIRNIALAAAFLAADDGVVVTMRHVIRATQREYQKMGKVVLEGEFGAYSSGTRHNA